MNQTQHEEKERDSKVINRSTVFQIINSAFLTAHNQLKNRTQSEQDTIGNLLTVLELELKKDLKEIKVESCGTTTTYVPTEWVKTSTDINDINHSC